MIDKVKRKTIKSLAVSVGVATGLASGSSSAFASRILQTESQEGVDQPLADIQVSSRVSSATNDLEVVITNAGENPTTVTQMTPAYTVTHRGQFDFTRLFDDGVLNLQPGQSVSVPLERHAVSRAGNSAPLTQSLRQSMSMITEGESFAKISVLGSTAFA